MRNLSILVLLTAGCAAPPPPGEVPHYSAGGYICSDAGLARFTGQPATQALGAEMQRESGARILQWVGHGMMVTMDFSPERLRVHLTADNRVERAACG